MYTGHVMFVKGYEGEALIIKSNQNIFQTEVDP